MSIRARATAPRSQRRSLVLESSEFARAASGSADPRAQQVEARQSYWRYGLLLMVAALVAESFVGRA